MSYIVPNSTVRIYSNAPFDPLYDHTVYWMGGTVAARLNNQKKYFNGENFDYSLIYKRPSDGANIAISESVTGLTPKYTLTAQSYQRAGKGKIRVQLSTDNLYLAQDIRKTTSLLCQNHNEPIFKIINRHRLYNTCADAEESFLLFILRMNNFLKKFRPDSEFF